MSNALIRDEVNQPSGTKMSSFIVGLTLTLFNVALFSTFSIWLGVHLGRMYNDPQILMTAAWTGMVLFYILNFIKKDIEPIMVKHLDESMFL